MKTTTLLSFLFSLVGTSLFAQSNIQQSVSINADGAAADASAQLDVKATDKGMLVPRMTTAQRTAIATPSTGLLVFDTTTGGFWFYNGTAWVNLSAPKTLADADNDTKVQVEKTADDDIIRFDIGGTEKMLLLKNINGAARLELPDLAYSTIIGQEAGVNNNPVADESGFENTFLGYRAGNATSDGAYNTFLGSQAGRSNTFGNSNTAAGAGALYSNSTGTDNTAAGSNALYANTTGYFNTATGAGALRLNTTGYFNTATGFDALRSNTNGFWNTAVGKDALFANTTGDYNTALGVTALAANSQGNRNTAVGVGALKSIVEGNRCTAVGVDALFVSTGNNNVAVGHQASYNNTSGGGNTAVGKDAMLFNTTGINNTAIGVGALFTADNLNNTTCIGQGAGGISNVSDRIEIGNLSVSWIGGEVNWSTYSDARIKTQVRENVPGLDFITRLRPVTYHLDIHKQSELCARGKREETDWPSKYDIEKKQMTGFIAQEVEQAAKSVGYDFSGVEKAADEVGMYSVRYSEFVVPLVKSVQEQQVIIEKLTAENEALKNQLQKITAALQGAGILVDK